MAGWSWARTPRSSARLADPERLIAKAASRDIGPLLAAGGLASTTVSATLRAAHVAGIAVMATGGIGGVHRDAGRTFDVSSDIDELAATPVAVVCSGAKSILDLPATLELLETRRIPVIGYGVDELPAFYSVASGLRLAHRVDTPEAAGRAIAAHRSVPGAGGILIVQPPPEDLALEAAEVEGWIRDALADADERGIRGGAVTPHLLASLSAASGGRTLGVNVALIVRNARDRGSYRVGIGLRRILHAGAEHGSEADPCASTRVVRGRTGKRSCARSAASPTGRA